LPIEGSVSITDVASFTKEMEELMNFENEVNFDKMNFDDLGLLTAKVKDIMTLDFIYINYVIQYR
jgi:hypothetical protein